MSCACRLCSAQQEVRPWIDSFQAIHGHKPTLQDALACGDAQVVEKYKRYQVQKDGLTSEIPTMRDALATRTKGHSGSNNRGWKRGPGYNGNIVPVSAAEATARVQAAMSYRREHQENCSSPSIETDASCDECQASRAMPDAAARIVGLQAKVERSTSAANGRAKSALLKALQYKQRGAASAQIAHEIGPQEARTESAVRLVSVEGKAIGGVDYSAIDASSAAAGESKLIRAGHMPVTSYRNAQSLGSSGSDTCCGLQDLGAEVQCGENSATVDATFKPATCTEPAIASPRSVQKSPAHLSGAGIPASGDSHDVSRPGSGAEGHSLKHPGKSKCMKQDEGNSGNICTAPILQPSANSVIEASPDSPTTFAGADGTTAALFELRGKRAAVTEAAAAAVVLTVACEHNGVFLKQNIREGSLVSMALAAARQAEQVHTEFDEARRSVMQLLRDGADTYCGGLMLLRRLF